jgi:hypothetical protein
MARDPNELLRVSFSTDRLGRCRPVLMAIALLVGAILISRIGLSGSTTEAKDMQALRQETLAGKNITPIDAAAPARTETATFAMG